MHPIPTASAMMAAVAGFHRSPRHCQHRIASAAKLHASALARGQKRHGDRESPPSAVSRNESITGMRKSAERCATTACRRGSGSLRFVRSAFAAAPHFHSTPTPEDQQLLRFSAGFGRMLSMDDPREASRILDRIAASVMPKVMKQLGEAYLRGYPAMLRYGPDGLDVEIIPADQFYITPDSPIP